MSAFHSARKRQRRQGSVLAESLVVLSMLGLAVAILSPAVDERAFASDWFLYLWSAGCFAVVVGAAVFMARRSTWRHKLALTLGLTSWGVAVGFVTLLVAL